MAHINWLHLSDWHHRTTTADRRVIAGKLIEDISKRAGEDAQLEHIDFIVFSGDIADWGDKDQFEQANELLIDPIRRIIGTTVPLYCVPGNHDIQRPAIKQIPSDWSKILAGGSERNEDIENLLLDPATLEILNKPLKNFYDFARQHGCAYDTRKLYMVRTIEKDGQKIGIACLNTAWHSARFTLQPAGITADPVVWDRGLLRITEAQISEALKQLEGVDVAIAVMHHPLHWLDEIEQAKAEQMVGRGCHIILHGHEHRPNMSRLSNAFGDIVTIPAGACYNRRIATDPRNSNAYNFCSLNLTDNAGTIFHRVWSEEANEWRRDERFWAKGQSHFFVQKKQPFEQQKIARKAFNQLSKNYLGYIYKRPALLQDIVMKHTCETVGGERFIRSRVRVRIELFNGARDPLRRTSRPRAQRPERRIRVLDAGDNRRLVLLQSSPFLREGQIYTDQGSGVRL